MIATDVTKDPDTLSMVVAAQLPTGVERAWQLWADPRQLERWWGPPTWPATFVDHDLTPGGKATYFMTGPDGEKTCGWWEIVAVEPPRRLELQDGFADESFVKNEAMPSTTMVVTLTARDGGTLMSVETRFPSLDAMEQMISMGMEEGIVAAVGQIEGILADAG